MPIVRKIEDLKIFIIHVLDKNKGVREVGLHTLKYYIASEFGFSPYVQKTVLNALLEYNFIERLGTADRFKIIYLEELDKKKAKQEAEDEIDKYL